jgi:uncharacterized phage protein gp47/JayE
MGVIVDYTSKDYDGFRSSLLTYAQQTYPEWQPGSLADFGVMMVEAFSYMGDILSYYGDRAANEAYLSTATQRQSILNIAELLGYIPGNRNAATGTVTVTNNDVVDFTMPKGFQFLTDYVADIDSPIIFEVDEETVIPAAGSVAVAVTEGETKGVDTFTVSGEEVIVTSLGQLDGTLDQVFTVPDCPVIDSSLRVFADTTTLVGDDIDEYIRYPFIIDAGPQDKGYEYRKDDKGTVEIVLGDGVNGVLPPTGHTVWAAYRVGGGTEGNVTSDSITSFGGESGLLEIVSSSAMDGGTVEETNAQIRTNAPLAYRTQQRAVTLEDYADLSLAISSVGKAKAVSNSFTSVTVYILGTNGTEASLGLKDYVREYLTERSQAGSTVTVSNVSVVPINIGATGGDETVIGVDDKFVRSSVQASVNQALLDFFATENTEIGQRISLSDIYRVIAAVEGVIYTNVLMLARDDAAQTGTADIVCQDWEIPIAGTFEFLASGGIG